MTNVEPLPSLRVARGALLAVVASLSLLACGPRAHIPELPHVVPDALDARDSGAVLARQLAPTLYLQRDESFPLSRAVAVLHPSRRIIAYHLLWRDDVMGSWVPFTTPTDQEIVWVGYDSTGAATDLWTYWHGTVLHADWRGKGQVLVDVQWGKHGSLPRGTRPETLPLDRPLLLYYVMAWALPDFWVGNLNRKGPWCFCGSFARYQEFTKELPLASRLDVIVRAEDPEAALRAVFGEKYSRKRAWP